MMLIMINTLTFPGSLLQFKVEDMGNTSKSMADSFQCMTKPTTIL